MPKENDRIDHVEFVPDRAESMVASNLKIGRDKTLLENAMHAAQREHDLSILETLKAYKSAVLWCLLISASIIMEVRLNTTLASSLTSPGIRHAVAR
jgi:SP family general alpha glucoside:H+ symporter-like MFS transporter